jgi:transcriptional regulator with XRE-family HTH domain
MAKRSPLYSGNQILKGLGTTIRALRKAKGWSQETLAHTVGIDRSYMGGIERGEHNLTIINLQKISQHLEIDLSQLIREAGF